MESWALFIPLATWLSLKKKPLVLKPVTIYLWVALVLNLSINCITELQIPLHFPKWLTSNNFLYNIHAVVRLILFCFYFVRLGQPFLVTIKKILPWLFVLFLAINFVFFQDFFNYDLLSNRLLAVESAILLFYCLQYYFYILLKDEEGATTRKSSFWIVTGLGIFIIISFPIYLFYRQIVLQNINFGVNIWVIQKIAFLCFCILTAIGIYQTRS